MKLACCGLALVSFVGLDCPGSSKVATTATLMLPAIEDPVPVTIEWTALDAASNSFTLTVLVEPPSDGWDAAIELSLAAEVGSTWLERSLEDAEWGVESSLDLPVGETGEPIDLRLLLKGTPTGGGGEDRYSIGVTYVDPTADGVRYEYLITGEEADLGDVRTLTQLTSKPATINVNGASSPILPLEDDQGLLQPKVTGRVRLRPVGHDVRFHLVEDVTQPMAVEAQAENERIEHVTVYRIGKLEPTVWAVPPPESALLHDEDVDPPVDAHRITMGGKEGEGSMSRYHRVWMYTTVATQHPSGTGPDLIWHYRSKSGFLVPRKEAEVEYEFLRKPNPMRVPLP